MPTFAADAPGKSVILSRAIFKLKDGQVWATEAAHYLACNLVASDIRWKADQSEVKNDRFRAIFEEEANRAGFKGSDNLFDANATATDFQVGVIIEDMQARLCYAPSDSGGPPVYRGTLLMTAQWQVYDPLRREVIARVTTSAGGEEKKLSRDGIELVVYAAFRESARALLADPAFRQAAMSSPRDSATTNQSLTPISFVSAPPVRRPIPDALGSVVAIFTDSGHGSGFLVSNDGYLITNQHVVGGSKYVKVRWSDGFETLGEVIRSDKRRDVALVKTDPHGRSPLSLRRGGVQAAEAVFALGTPLDPKFQGTVTKGVVSSTRILDGFAFIQSDVTVNPGNSGGPLLDEAGAVVGIAVLAYRPDDLPTGINLFIPIGDALDFLNLKPGA